MRLQCYEGLDEAKALYEWNYRKQLLRIQAEAQDTGWNEVQDDIFGEEFLLTRPLLQAISSEEPVVLLIDEIDKTDQEFEAMLLEILSDFQVSIPELGASRRAPAGRAADEQQHARADRGAQAPVPVPVARLPRRRARAGDRPPPRPRADATVARKLVEVIGMVRDLDLKKPPSIAESIDWARALLLLGATDIDDAVFRDTMSVIVKHRTDLDLVAERVGVKLGHAGLMAVAPARAIAARLVEFCEELRSEGVAAGTSELLDGFAVLDEVAWTDPEDFRAALSATLAKSPEDRRIFELVFDRFFFRAAEAAAVEVGVKESDGGDRQRVGLRRDEPRHAAPADRRGAARRLGGRAARPRAAGDRRVRPSGRGVGRHRRRRAAHPSLARPARGAPARPAEDDPRRDGLPREQLRRFEELLRRELERQQIERTETLPPKRPLNELDRALPSGPLQDLAAVHRVVTQLKRRLKTQGQESRGHRRHAHVDVRRTMRASLETGGVPVQLRYRPKRRAGRRSTCCATSSTSVTSASVFFLSVLHALHDSFRKMRSFVFIERISEVTDVFLRERDFANVSEAIAKDAGVADVSGYTDYGRVWSEFRDLVDDDLHPRATVIVLGDARTNGRDPRRRRLRPGRRARRAGRSGSTPSRGCTGTTATRSSRRTSAIARPSSAGPRPSSRTSSRRSRGPSGPRSRGGGASPPSQPGRRSRRRAA